MKILLTFDIKFLLPPHPIIDEQVEFTVKGEKILGVIKEDRIGKFVAVKSNLISLGLLCDQLGLTETDIHYEMINNQ